MAKMANAFHSANLDAARRRNGDFMGFVTGLVSISFRGLTTDEILGYVREASLDAIEWGGDVHVPAGNIDVAEKVGMKTRASGLLIPEYGSYYRLGVNAEEELDAVVASAKALGTDTVRIWAYNKSSARVSDEEYEAVVASAKRICQKYPEIVFCTECHNYTLTDDCDKHLKLLKDVGMENFKTFWQPNQLKSFAYNQRSAELLAPYTKAVHVFSWEGDRKLPLIDHRDRWIAYLNAFLPQSRERDMHLMFEFMHDNRAETLAETAKQLRAILCEMYEK
jgi:sugar phosphate isomerase/epimerase